jgi:hypothetical protein
MEGKEKPENLILPEPSHIGYISRDIERTKKNLQKFFGLDSFTMMIPEYFNKKYREEPEDFRSQYAFCRVGNIVYELMQVLHGETTYGDFMKEHGEGIHHLGYEISDLAKWTEAYKKVGIEPIMSGERVGLKFAYINTPEIIVELIERTPVGKVV